jgi:hydroxymethylpyrimidine pyrophosphatase-like HAD family hydrolase
MRFRVLACDFDNTIATDGRVTPATLEALEDVRLSGRRLLLVTGRTVAELQAVFPDASCFDLVVAENGAVLHEPTRNEEELITDPIAPRLVAELQIRGVSPLSVGRGICSTVDRHRATVLAVIHDLGLDLHVIVNRGAVMVLPVGVSKASGARIALRRLGEKASATVAVGDAENDIALLGMSGCGVAVANALESVKAKADLVMSGRVGAGVVELIGHLLADDLDSLLRQARRRAG